MLRTLSICALSAALFCIQASHSQQQQCVSGVSAAAADWQPKASMLFKRSDMVALQVNKYTYILGGCVNDQLVHGTCTSFTGAMTRYDAEANTWTELSVAPQPRYRYAAAAVGTKLFYFGGRTIVNDSVIEDIDVFDTTASTWSTLASLKLRESDDSLRSDAAAFVIGTKIYVSGGYSADYRILNSTFVVDTQAATPTIDTTSVPTKPIAAGDNGAVAIAGRGYVFGGFADSFCVPIATLERFDPATNSWSQLPNSLKPRGDMGVAAIGTKLYVTGGEAKDAQCAVESAEVSYSVPIGDVESFDTATSVWTRLTPIAITRFRFTSAAFGNSLLDFGGQGQVVGNFSDSASYFPLLSSVYALDTTSVTPSSGAVGFASASSIAVLAVASVVAALL